MDNIYNHINTPIALVTGGTGSIGEAVCRKLAQKDYIVILTGKNKKKVNSLVKKLNNDDLNVIGYKLDVSSQKDVEEIYTFIVNRFGKLDILINNAGIYLDNRKNNQYPDFFDLKFGDLKKTMSINFYGPYLLTKKFLPLMKKNNYGRIVNVSSGMARFEDLDVRGPFYRMSKVALNALTCILADAAKGHNICVNSVCPGWVRSKMGTQKAVRSPEEGSEGIIWAATLEDHMISGLFFRDGQPLDWCKKMGDPY